MTFNFQGVFGVILPEEIKFEWASICGFVNDPSRSQTGPVEHQRFPDAMRHAYGFPIKVNDDPLRQIRDLRNLIASLPRNERGIKREVFWSLIEEETPKPKPVTEQGSVYALCKGLLAGFGLDNYRGDPFEMTAILLERYYLQHWRQRRYGEPFEDYCRAYFTKTGRLKGGIVQPKPIKGRKKYRRSSSIAGAC